MAGSRLTILVNCAYDCNTARERQSLAHQLMGVYAANKRNRSRSPAQVVVWLPAPEVEGKLRDKGAGNWPAFRIVPREGAAATDAAAAAATAAEAAAASEAAAAAAAGVVVGDAGVKDRAAAAAADGVQGAAALAGSEWVRESPGRVVILTPDSEVELDRVEDGDVFVIGGIVDRSVRRGQTLRTALDLGVRHARLPIARALASEGEELAVGSVLNVDTVAEAIMRRKVRLRACRDFLRTYVPYYLNDRTLYLRCVTFVRREARVRRLVTSGLPSFRSLSPSASGPRQPRSLQRSGARAKTRTGASGRMRRRDACVQEQGGAVKQAEDVQRSLPEVARVARGRSPRASTHKWEAVQRCFFLGWYVSPSRVKATARENYPPVKQGADTSLTCCAAQPHLCWAPLGQSEEQGRCGTCLTAAGTWAALEGAGPAPQARRG